jgi:imidazole glycerol-phosphate synthase subunit HisF
VTPPKTALAGIRIIPRLDIKGPNLIKGIHLEGLRVVGDPHAFALDYYRQGADELVFMDIVASLYQRNNLTEIIKRAADQIFVPITVGGGIRSLDDVRTMLHSGADKVAINTAAVARPGLITEVSQRFGSQCMVLSVEAKRKPGGGGWEAFTDNGREHTGLDVAEWAEKAVAMGAGEIMLTSIDQEGTRKGFDVDLVRTVAARVKVPIIASGGYGRPSDLALAAGAGASGLAIADALHWKRTTVAQLKAEARAGGLEVRL